jgi:hypothetical protein
VKRRSRTDRVAESTDRARPSRLAPLFAVAALGLLLLGCDVFAPRFGTAFPAEGEIPEVPVSLTDRTGSVAKLATTPADPDPTRQAFIGVAPARADQLIVQWVGTGCDANVILEVVNSAAAASPGAPTHRPEILISVGTERREGACEAAQIRRALVIEFTQLVDMRRTSVRFTR